MISFVHDIVLHFCSLQLGSSSLLLNSRHQRNPVQSHTLYRTRSVRMSFLQTLFTRSPLRSLHPSPFSFTHSTIPSSSSSRSFTSSIVLNLLRKPTKTKLKTHKGAAKRWLVVAGGAFKRVRSDSLHLFSSLSRDGDSGS